MLLCILYMYTQQKNLCKILLVLLMTCKKTHFPCKNLAPARSCTKRARLARILQVLCKTCKKRDIFRARILQKFSCKSCKTLFAGYGKNCTGACIPQVYQRSWLSNSFGQPTTVRNFQCQQISAHIIQPTISNSCSLNPQPKVFR